MAAKWGDIVEDELGRNSSEHRTLSADLREVRLVRATALTALGLACMDAKAACCAAWALSCMQQLTLQPLQCVIQHASAELHAVACCAA